MRRLTVLYVVAVNKNECIYIYIHVLYVPVSRVDTLPKWYPTSGPAHILLSVPKTAPVP